MATMNTATIRRSGTNGDKPIDAIASINPNTIIILHTVSPVLMPWINHPNITAVVYTGLPGQESGNSLVDVLYGIYNPSARLHYTIAKKRKGYLVDVISAFKSKAHEILYTKDFLIDYHWFDQKNIVLQFELR